MIIIYKGYKSSSIATFMSLIATICILSGGFMTLCSILHVGAIDLSTSKFYLTLLIVGIILYFLAKYIAKQAHIRKLHSNLKYTREFVAEHPEKVEVQRMGFLL